MPLCEEVMNCTFLHLVACPSGLRPVEQQDAMGQAAIATSSARLLHAIQTCISLFVIVDSWQNISHHHKLLDADVFNPHLVPMDVIAAHCLTMLHCIASLYLIGRDEQVREGGRE